MVQNEGGKKDAQAVTLRSDRSPGTGKCRVREPCVNLLAPPQVDAHIQTLTAYAYRDYMLCSIVLLNGRRRVLRSAKISNTILTMKGADAEKIT